MAIPDQGRIGSNLARQDCLTGRTMIDRKSANCVGNLYRDVLLDTNLVASTLSVRYRWPKRERCFSDERMVDQEGGVLGSEMPSGPECMFDVSPGDRSPCRGRSPREAMDATAPGVTAAWNV